MNPLIALFPSCRLPLLTMLRLMILTVRISGKKHHIAQSYGAQVCFSCLSEPPRYSQMNFTELQNRLIRGGLNIPKSAKNCRDTPANKQVTFRGSEIVFCKKSKTCMKLNGIFEDEPWVYRNCWDNAWEHSRKFNQSWGYSCYDDKDKTGFVNTDDTQQKTPKTKLCFCAKDLCNTAAPASLKTLLPSHHHHQYYDHDSWMGRIIWTISWIAYFQLIRQIL